MNKLLFLLLSRIKGTIFVLNSYTEYNIDFKFLFQIKNLCLNGFKIIRPIIFCSQEGEFSTVKVIFLDRGIFPQSR